uniref:YitT family protein n=1 Tax=Agathobacter sp. TaxID=2021311 RepID=UPI004056D4DD
MKISKKYKKIFEYGYVLAGTALLAFAIQCLYDPVELVTGGFTGLAIIVKNVTGSLIEGGIPLWFSNLVLNIPVFVIGFFLKGKSFIGKTLFGTVMLSIWLYVIPVIELAEGDYMIAAIFGGALAGLGIGLVLKAGATTGGTDMVASLLQMKLRHYSVVQIMQVLDNLIVVTGLFIFGMRPALYSIIAIVVSTYVSDMVLEGANYAKGVFIITSRHEEVAGHIMEELERGVTGLYAKGMYTGDDKCMLYCVVSMKEIVKLKDFVIEADPEAFVIVSDVREVLGEGFQEYSK